MLNASATDLSLAATINPPNFQLSHPELPGFTPLVASAALPLRRPIFLLIAKRGTNSKAEAKQHNPSTIKTSYSLQREQSTARDGGGSQCCKGSAQVCMSALQCLVRAPPDSSSRCPVSANSARFRRSGHLSRHKRSRIAEFTVAILMCRYE
jgi:hypothetical protein